MIAWLFASLGHALIGLVLLIGTLGVAVFTLARAIGTGYFTDHHQWCQCGTCQERRLKAYRREQREKARGRMPVQTGMVSSESLRTGDRVEAKGVTYEVTSIVGHEYGLQLFMTNMGTGKRTMLTIRRAIVREKIWKLVN